MDNNPMDVWLAFDSLDEDEATAEAHAWYAANGFDDYSTGDN